MRRIIAALWIVCVPIPAQAEGNSLELGMDLLGQACHADPRPTAEANDRSQHPTDVFCGSDAKPVATVQTIRLSIPLPHATQPEFRDALLKAAAAHSGVMADKVSCTQGDWVPAETLGELYFEHCSYRDGGWPAVKLTAVSGDTLFIGDGPPATLPVIASFISRQSRPTSSGDSGVGSPIDIDRMKPVLGNHSSLYRASDVTDFQKLTDLARLNDIQGDYERAEANYRQALAIQERVLGNKFIGIGTTLMALAVEVSNQGRFEEAHDLFQQAEPLVQQSVDPLDEARLASNLAIDAANRHHFDEARELAHRATTARRAMIESDPSGASHDLGSLNMSLAQTELVQSRMLEGQMSLRLGDIPKALEAANEAYDIALNAPTAPILWKPDAISLMGEVKGKSGKPKEAETLLKEAITQYHRLFGDTLPTASAWLTLGNFYSDQGRFSDAMETYHHALPIFERTNSKLSFDAVASFFSTSLELAEHQPENRQAILDDVFDILQQVQQSKAANVSTKSVLHSLLKDAGMDDLNQQIRSAHEKAEELRVSLAAEVVKPIDQRDADREKWLGENYRQALVRGDDLEKRLKEEIPGYYRLAYPRYRSVKDVQSALNPSEALLTFSFGREFGLVFCITKTSTDVKVIQASDEDISDSVNQLRSTVTVRNGRVENFDLAMAYQLYQKLIMPVSNSLNGTQHVIIAASGSLASLPFSALVTSSPQGQDLGNAAWMIRQTSVSQIPSIPVFFALKDRQAASSAPKAFLGIGNPHFTGDASGGGVRALMNHCRDNGPMPPDLLRALPPLPDTATEVMNVAKVMKAHDEDILLADRATETAFRSHDPSQYRVLYFATHGLLPEELRCQAEPALALSPSQSVPQSKDDDGLLEASEIAGLKLDADLVVLSACNTAIRSGHFGGDNLESLADTFFYAGARSVLATHWSVPSRSTSQLMTAMFAKYTADSQDGYASALRNAQLAMIRNPETAHPVHWAGFSLIGVESPTKGAKP